MLEEPLPPEASKGMKESESTADSGIAAAVVLVAVAIGLFLYYRNRESTDDAQVDGHITPIAAKISGRVAEVLVHDNQPVKAGQVLVKIDPRDYQAALDNANAALALAQSEAQSASVDVPRTRENVSQRNFQCGRGTARRGSGIGAGAGGLCAGAKLGPGVCAGQHGQEQSKCGTGASGSGALQAVNG